MTVSENGLQKGNNVTPTDVLDTFAVYQGQTAAMVAEKLAVNRETAIVLLDELVARGSLTKARANTETPVWVLAHPRRKRLHE